ncbi:PHD finger protein MALE MEIOCYTE DEATH 1-like [Impatiens glandulifera]|uniref:PHD finger protein MALE MEIOCYTE DEATH 1-like n=1 Tax=Impatiens glandulifera TaxID=253017 RepID=UPI001FB10730|nr:PHD finger protein MALE MEIOCYTE DEATH 1-like [Impatiens glandulifera]
MATTQSQERKLFPFHTFASSSSIVVFRGLFQNNIRRLLQEYGEIEDHGTGMLTWSIYLVVGPDKLVLPLYIVEENVEHSHHPFCNHCESIGWGHHFVSKRRYHMIIPAVDELKNSFQFQFHFLHLGNHLLHALIHCNGFGHLLSINRIQCGSTFLGETDFMNLWDRICTVLRIRKISVSDNLKRGTIELRLLQNAAQGRSWFETWGYKFSNGSFDVTEDDYNMAVHILTTLDLDKITYDFRNSKLGLRLVKIIQNYRGLSKIQLITIGDLLQFMLGLDSIDRKNKKKSTDSAVSLESFVSSLANIDCRWSEKRLEYVMKVISNQLKSKRGNENVEYVMSRKELRDAARQYIGDTGLIDFLLKSINCVRLGDHVIRRTINPSTKLVEFSIKESSEFVFSQLVHDSRWPKKRLEYATEVIMNILKEKKSMQRQELRDAARVYVGDTGLIDYVLKSIDGFVFDHQIVSRSRNSSTKMIEFAIIDHNSSSLLPGMEIYNDVLFIYENVLMDYPESESDSVVSLASRVVLYSKNFVKEEWEVVEENDNDESLMTLTCRVLPSFDELETELKRPLPPGELVRVPAEITIGELKVVAQDVFRDTYCLMDKFEVKQIGGLKGMEDDTVLSCAVEPGAHVWVRGCGLDLCTPLRYQSG